MIRKYALVLFVPAFLVGIWAYASNIDQGKSDEQIVAEIITGILESSHYSPKSFDDNVSEHIFHKYLEQLDYNKHYFLASDIKKLEKYEHEIDDELRQLDLTFYRETVDILYKRLAEVEAFYQELLSKPFDFSEEEFIETDPEKREYFETAEERKEYWRKYLKLLTMNRLANKIQKQEKDQKSAEERDEEFDIQTRDELEEAARKQVIKNLGRRFKRRDEIDNEDQFAYFMNAVSSAFGPHSQYFPPQEKENFDMRMTGRLEGIGAQLTKENEYIKVVKIVPGSASWRQGDLKANDLIIKVAQGENEEPVDITDATMKEAISLIRGPKGSTVVLTVQKPNGEVVEIPIERDVVVQEETYAKSAMIEHKGKQKVGYVYLPTFYSTFGKRKGRKCAEDVINEIEMLSEKGAEGIILDLRNNGGGSLQEAIDLVGHFVDRGPVVQVKAERRPARVYSDRDKGIAYDGKLLVMVNGFSASASEILAGALKDYDRAVVVGSSTFGKGTVQTMLDMNRYLGPNDEPSKALGSYKVTIQQFYRINGASTQLKGVHPHIKLPDEYGYMETGISSYDNALPWDSIKPANYEKWPSQLKFSKLKKKSTKRVSKHDIFAEVEKRNADLKKERENTLELISIDAELKRRAENKEKSDYFEELNHKNEDVVFSSLQHFKPEEEDDVKKEKRERWEKELAEDFYLNEAIMIMLDMI